MTTSLLISIGLTFGAIGAVLLMVSLLWDIWAGK